MKRKTTKEILAESFYELAENKGIDKITVKSITDNCGYSPATFYRQFRDKYDLIAWAYAGRVEEIMGQIGRESYTWKDTLLEGAEFFWTEREYLSNLLLHTSGHDSFIRYMTDIHFNALKDFFLGLPTDGKTDQSVELYIRAYCLATVNLTCEWLMGRYQMTPGEMARIYEEILPLPLRELLIG